MITNETDLDFSQTICESDIVIKDILFGKIFKCSMAYITCPIDHKYKEIILHSKLRYDKEIKCPECGHEDMLTYRKKIDPDD